MRLEGRGMALRSKSTAGAILLNVRAELMRVSSARMRDCMACIMFILLPVVAGAAVMRRAGVRVESAKLGRGPGVTGPISRRIREARKLGLSSLPGVLEA